MLFASSASSATSPAGWLSGRSGVLFLVGSGDCTTPSKTTGLDGALKSFVSLPLRGRCAHRDRRGLDRLRHLRILPGAARAALSSDPQRRRRVCRRQGIRLRAAPLARSARCRSRSRRRARPARATACRARRLASGNRDRCDSRRPRRPGSTATANARPSCAWSVAASRPGRPQKEEVGRSEDVPGRE